jgi:hypothetical protein
MSIDRVIPVYDAGRRRVSVSQRSFCFSSREHILCIIQDSVLEIIIIINLGRGMELMIDSFLRLYTIS